MKLTLCKLAFIIGSTFFFTIACDDGSDSKDAAPAAAPTGETAGDLPSQVAVSGSLNLAAGTTGTVSDKPVQLIDNSGLVHAEGKTEQGGAFKLALGGNSLTDGADFPSLLKVKSLFLDDGAKLNGDNSALGVQQDIYINPGSLTAQADGSAGFAAGSFKAKKVTAIWGKITLETGEDPTGIDVFVPGTTYISKTDSNGEFLLGFLPQGTYKLRADKDGFGSIEWADVVVKKKETTSLTPAIMKISKGPEVVSYSLDLTDPNFTLSQDVNVVIETKGASKYRISQLVDFRDTVFLPIDATAETMTFPFFISGDNGQKKIYLEVADADGLSVSTSLDVLLDTKIPTMATYEAYSADAKSGYTNSTTPKLYMNGCDDINKIFFTEDKDKVPTADEFTLSCETSKESGVEITVSSTDGAKTLYGWALDYAKQVSAASKSYTLTLDTVAPTFTLTPNPTTGDQVLSTDSVEVVITPSEKVDLHYTVDQSAPSSSSPILETQKAGKGTLVFIGNTTLRTIAYDLAGNASSETKRELLIDRDKPILGTIKVTSGKSLLNAIAVPLTVSAQGASKMRFAETEAGLASASWNTYATTHTYTLTNTSDGSKTIFVSFSDDAGNLLGENGEFYTTFTLDRTAPIDGKIKLLPPESPTGAFNLGLTWTSEYTEAITYTVEVHNNLTYTGLQRTMTTTDTTVNIKPALSNTGTYYWRVRGTDAAGNNTAWVTSGKGKRFELKILTTSFQSNLDIPGEAGTDHFFAKTMVKVGDLNSDGKSEIAYTVPQTEYTYDDEVCLDCAEIRILDPNTGEDIASIREGADKTELYGEHMVMCDVTGDSADELIVAAPGTPGVDANETIFYNVGAVYVYDMSDYSLIDSHTPTVDSNTDNSYFGCFEFDFEDPAKCFSYGQPEFPKTLTIPLSYNGPKFGTSLTCVDSDSGATGGKDAIIVGTPFYNTDFNNIGKIEQFEVQSGSLTKTKTTVGPSDTFDSGYGTAVVYLNKFKYNENSPTGNCNTSGPKLAVGMPTDFADGTGKVQILEYASDNWTKCGEVPSKFGDGNYGLRLFNLGNLDKDSDNHDELAIAGPQDIDSFGFSFGSGGAIRIIEGDSGTTTKAYVNNEDFENSNYGWVVAPAGDFNTTADSQSELVITIPGAFVAGKFRAGKVLIMNYASMDSTDDTTGTIVREIVGKPYDGAFLGAAFIPIFATAGDMHTQTSQTFISRPERSINGSFATGSLHEFSLINLAPSLPEKIEGSSTGARMGASITGVPDLDNDNVSDYIFGQPGAFCNGKPWGAATLYSGLDGVMNISACNETADRDTGSLVQYFPTAKVIGVADGERFRMIESSGFVTNRDTSDTTPWTSAMSTDFLADPNWTSSPSYPKFSTNADIDHYPHDGTTDRIVLGDGKGFGDGSDSNYYSRGNAKVFDLTSSSFTEVCEIQGVNGTGKSQLELGTGVSFIDDINNDGTKDIVVGIPNGPTPTSSVKGVVMIISGADCESNPTITIDLSDENNYSVNAGLLMTITADDALLKASNAIGKAAINGFGATVQGLPDYNGDDSADPNEKQAWLLIGNTNMNGGTSSSTPQYVIVNLYDSDDDDVADKYAYVTHENGITGGMLAGNVVLLPDINGDGAKDIAMAYPGGVGRFGNTGQVRIYSGKELGNSSPSFNLLQMLYNPEPAAASFGKSIEYADITGDALKDFVVGDDKYDSSAYQDAGAIFIFPMEPISTK